MVVVWEETMSPDKEKKRVLVVEDDKAIRSMISNIIGAKGFDVVQAVDGEEALKLVDEADVVLLDLFMPKMTGEEFLQRVRKAGNYVPVVVMSAGYGKKEGIDKLKSYGIVDFIPKPFSNKEVSDKVAHAAGQADEMKFVGIATDRLKGFIERQKAL